MPKRKTNLRARNIATGETCGHHHHTREKALECVERMGWNPDDCTIEEFYDNGDRKASMHHRPKNGRRGTRKADF